MAAYIEPLRYSTVRICDETGDFHGLGYRLTYELIITCAHVVAKTLRADTEVDELPSGTLWVNAPFSKRANESFNYIAASVLLRGWFPKRASSRVNEPVDLAVLRLKTPLVDPLAPLSLGLSFVGCEFLTYGGIKGHESLLVPIEGFVCESLANGCYKLVTPIGNYSIEQGASGAAVCDKTSGAVIGIIAQAEYDPKINVGFMIPAEHIRNALEYAGVARGLPGTLASFRDELTRWIRPFDYLLADSCQRFIDYYAGTDSEPMPFAGREKELAELDCWLRIQTPGFRLLSGPAGRGKSALLLHWAARQLAFDPELSIIFLPISIRFETSDELRGLRLLHAQLTVLFPELRFPPETKPDPDDYRMRICSGWKEISEQYERRFLLVIDGADEAASVWIGRQVLPYNIPHNLAILLSARHKPGHKDGSAWLDDFHFSNNCSGIDSLELMPLTANAVGDAVVQLGHPMDTLIERDQVLSELFRLTDQGDPLLVSLWVRQLWDERERVLSYSAIDMQKLQPGFTGFLKVWRAEQEKIWRALNLTVHSEDMDCVLRLLAHAYAPLRGSDLYELLVRYCSSINIKWDFEFLRVILGSAARLVVQIGEAYTFVHPRLGDHYRADSQMHKIEKIIYPRAYLLWGQAIVLHLNLGKIDSCQCSSYLLRHFVSHVNAAALPVEKALNEYLLPLLKGGWHKAWLEEEGAYGGFLADLGYVKDLLKKVNSVCSKSECLIADEMLVLLIKLSIRAQSANLSPELLMALVQSKIWPSLRGLGMAAHLPDPAIRTVAFVSLAEELIGTLRLQALNQALASVLLVEDELWRVQMLIFLAGQLSGNQRRHTLAQILSIIGTQEKNLLMSKERACLLIDFSKLLADEPLLLAKAIDAGSSLRSDKWRIIALMFLGFQLSDNQRLFFLSTILFEIKDIVDEYDRYEIIVAVASRLLGEPILLTSAFEIVSDFKDNFLQVRALIAIARQMTGDLRQQTLDVAFKISLLIKDSRRAVVFAELSELLDNSSRQQVLVHCIDAVPIVTDEVYRAEVIVALVGKLSNEFDLFDKALVLASNIENVGARAQAVAAIAENLPSQSVLLNKASEIACGIDSAVERVQALVAIASRQSAEDKIHTLSNALQSIDFIENEKRRAESLVSVIRLLSGESALCSQVLLIIKRINDEDCLVMVLASVAEQLVGNHKLLALVLDLADAIKGEGKRVRALVKIAGCLSDDSILISKALAITVAVRDEEARSLALVALSNWMCNEKRQNILNKAFQYACLIGNERARSHAFVAVAGLSSREQRRLVLSQAIDVVKQIGDQATCGNALIEITKHLEDEPKLIVQALSAATFIVNKNINCQVVAAIADKASGGVRINAVNSVLATVRSSSSKEEGIEGLISVIGVIDRKRREQIIEFVLTEISGLSSDYWRAQTLSALTEHLADYPCFIDKAYSLVAEIVNKRLRGKAMATIAINMTGQRQLQVFTKALTLISSIYSDSDRAEGLGYLMKYIFNIPNLAAQAISVAVKIDSHISRASALIEMLKYLNDGKLLAQVVDSAREITDDLRRANVLISIVAKSEGILRAQILHEAFASIIAIKYESGRVEALKNIAGQIAYEVDLLDEFFDEICKIKKADDFNEIVKSFLQEWVSEINYSYFARILEISEKFGRASFLELIPYLQCSINALGGHNAVEGTAQAIIDTAEWWP